jgi:hypothetical protein
MNSSSVAELQPGAIAYGRSGVPYEVLECRANCITLRRSDGASIEVKPTAIIRWDKVSKIPLAEREVKISSEPSETKNETLELFVDKLSTSDDSHHKYRQNIVRQNKVSSEYPSIVRSIVRSKPHTEKGFQQLSDSSDDSDDIFTHVSAEGNFETFASSPPPNLPPTIGKGSTVGKRLNLGWLGWVQSDPVDGQCEVLWQYDRHPTLEKLTDLKIKEIK